MAFANFFKSRAFPITMTVSPGSIKVSKWGLKSISPDVFFYGYNNEIEILPDPGIFKNNIGILGAFWHKKLFNLNGFTFPG